MLDEAESRATIVEIIARYCFAVDLRDIDSLMALMTEDICYAWREDKTITGKESVQEYVEHSWTTLGPTLHGVSSPPLVNFTSDDDAVSLHYGHAEHVVNETGRIMRSAMAYVNRYRRGPNGWRLCWRTADTLYSSDAGQLEVGYRSRENAWSSDADQRDSIFWKGWQAVSSTDTVVPPSKKAK